MKNQTDQIGKLGQQLGVKILSNELLKLCLEKEKISFEDVLRVTEEVTKEIINSK